ncbi:MAG: protein kinase [Myxococcales bacterium]|nr:protein kinase [Myxococcales bacterium]
MTGPATTAIPGADDASDAELVLAYRELGRDAAYGELVRRYQIRLFRLLLGLMSGGDEAESTCEDVFVSAARDLVELEDPSGFYPWLVDRAQRQAESTVSMSVVTRSPDARDHVLSAVRAALDTLSPEERMVLVLSELQRDPPESVARTLGRPVTEVVELIQTARARFVAELSEIDTVGEREGTSSPPEVRPGMVVDGRYRVGRLLGRGGHGSVFLAEHLGLKRDVALKVLRPEGASHEAVRERFRREALVLGRLDHECFVDVIDFGETQDGLLFLALELLEGESLGSVLERGALPRGEALSIARDLLRGLEHIHGQDVVHRDLKPDNVILVAREEGRRLPKILDLGIAKLVTRDAATHADPDLTRTNALMGTPKYMAPEQAAGDPVDPRADLYALGVVLFEMLTGAVPFDGTSDFEVMSRIVQEDPPQLSALNAGLPPAIEVVLSMALAKDREDRFQSCEALWTAFEEACAPPVIASPSPVGERAPLEAPSAAEDPRPSAEPRERSLGEVWASLNASARAAIILLGVVALVAMLWPGGRGGGGQAASPSLSPEQVVRAWVAANSARDTDTMMSYYAPRVQWYNLYLADYELHTRKAKHHRKFDLRNDETMSNPTVRYNGDRTRAIVDYDSSWRSQSSGDDPFWFDARRRIRLKRIDGRWLIDCEEEIEIYRASNPKAEGTDLCEF